ncbi:hypothetical protein F4777DRAFT_393827 [Nemania sp. FL0916]|nr:hypothetical protein F4777DRAFT_393827 [Nemania sp. FL0916]
MTEQLDRQPSPPHRPIEDDNNAALFSEVLSALDQNQLPLLGRDTLQRIQPQLALADTKPVVGEPMYGSYHVLFPLTFPTGLCWLVKIPVNGTEDMWDDTSTWSLIAEAKTMRLLKSKTTIPLPDVLGFSSTTQNALRCPYILMSYISGVPLYEVWFGHRRKGDELEVNRARRTRALEDIASAMKQLDSFSFPTSGSLLFTSDGSVSGTGPIRRIDQQAMLDRWFVHQDPADDPIYASQAASSDTKAYYTFMLDLHARENPFRKGCVALLRQLISWIPQLGEPHQFVLAHPDFDIQNFIVSEEGELRGIIDWDGIGVVPRTIGNARYPGWLTRDWDPAMYGYEESMDQGFEPVGVWEDSPACLASYRQVYKDAITKGQDDGTTGDLCRMSLITENLYIAADNPQCQGDILRKVVQEAWNRAGRDDDLDFKALVTTFIENNVDASVMDALQVGFNALLAEECL